ncbi:conserved oligomeric Golgi complex subunit 1-like [Mytilus edulis]|uniref:conserved oligomeric Golgi complex subunit 1-like n=1 Tax=Mytilus edulis TaxID=6550 RepID=UPI0039EFB259
MPATQTTEMSKVDSKSVPIEEMDTKILFEKFTIEEIRSIEKKTRTDIERKKEDLRTMVGERYRDLIEAADTITDMKNSAQNVMSSIAKMEDMCKQLKEHHMVKGSSYHTRSQPDQLQKRKKEVKFYGVASQIKLLLDMPEKIWSSLDDKDYLTATRHYLLSRHIHTSLQLESQHSTDLLSWFPVLTRQWAAISHFRSTILSGCRGTLKETFADDKSIAECLCAIVLLEDSTPRQVFNEFLLARTTAVQQLFHSSQQTASIKDQICTVVQLIIKTVHQIHSVFYVGDSTSDKLQNNLLLSILNEVTTKKQNETGLLDLQTSISSKCLPKSVTEFCPSLRSHANPVSEQHLQDNCQQWINTCISDVTTGVGKLLNFINTVKRLADIRDAVWELLSQDESMIGWDTVCNRIMNRQLSIWDGILRNLFVDRVKSLIQYQLESSTEVTKRQVSKVVMEMANTEDSIVTADTDLAWYVWNETSGDISSNMAWIPSTARSTSDNPGGLIMKAKAFTPVVQSLCKNFDEKLKSMLDDATTYTQTSDEKETENIAFDKYSDTDNIYLHIKSSCHDCVKGLIEHLNEQLKLWEKSLKEIPDAFTNAITKHRVLLVGRLCTALCDLVPSLQNCILQQSDQAKIKKVTPKGSKPVEDPVWTKVKEMLANCQLEAFRIWVDHLSDVVLKEFRGGLVTDQNCHIVTNCTRWDEVDIQEETEDGKKIKSKISVPMQPSWYVQGLVFTLCQEINRVGGHAVTRSILQKLVNKVSDEMKDNYLEIIHNSKNPKTKGYVPLPQQRALQLLFDVRFVLSIFPRKEDSKENKVYQQRMHQIIEGLEEKIDPFDLDVFTPYIQSHLLKQAQRSAVLYGLVTNIDRLSMYGGGRTTSSQQEQHNVLPLTVCQNRFTLLPLSTQPSRSSLPQPVLKQPLQKPIDSGRSLTETAAAVLPQSSLQSDMTSSLFSKVGSMSSMSDISNWFKGSK